jgi:hypothetical protein
MTKPGDECIKKYEEKEKKRKDKTQKAIKLDE